MSKPLPELPELLPGFAERLEARAEEVAASHRETTRADHAPKARGSRGRRRWQLAGGAALAGLVAISGAYATGLWRPQLGSNPDDPPVASARAVAPELLDRIGALRRSQTDADRGAAASYALKFPATSQTGIQTGAVRTASLPAGGLVVLVPVVDLRTGAQELCLWVRQAGESTGGRSCAGTPQVLNGGLVQSTGPAPDPTSEAQRAQRRRDAQGEAEGGSGVQQPADGLPEVFRVVGVAPDEVRSVRIGSGDPIPVDGNLFEGTVTELPADLRARWDD